MLPRFARSSFSLLSLVVLTGLCTHAQDNPIRVGVAVMQNQAGRSVSGTLERDRLVQALNHMKPDKKTHVQVEAVALDAMLETRLMTKLLQKNARTWCSQR